MKTLSKLLSASLLFALAALLASACSDPEIDHYTNSSSDVYLDKLLGIEGAADNADSVLFSLGKGWDCYETDSTGKAKKRQDTLAVVDCVRDSLASKKDSLLEANAPSSEAASSRGGKSSSSEGGSSEEGISGEGVSSDSSNEFNCEEILEWTKGVAASMYEDGLCQHETEGVDFVYECLEETMCKSVVPGTNVSVWKEKGRCIE